MFRLIKHFLQFICKSSLKKSTSSFRLELLIVALIWKIKAGKEVLQFSSSKKVLQKCLRFLQFPWIFIYVDNFVLKHFNNIFIIEKMFIFFQILFQNWEVDGFFKQAYIFCTKVNKYIKIKIKFLSMSNSLLYSILCSNLIPTMNSFGSSLLYQAKIVKKGSWSKL